MQHRAEIDGLRALAVLPVILFHAGFAAFNGGFVGVDIFFVISGYLITRMIYEGTALGNFSLADFYERRARRILPALFVMTLLCTVVAWHVLMTDELKGFADSAAAVGVFVSNFYFWLHSDYFATRAGALPLHHTWSLAVEEQFYIVYPLVLLWLRRATRSTLAWTILVGSLVSLGVAEYASRAYPSGNFYLMPGRAWELGAGALVALTDREYQSWRIGLRQLLATAGLAALALSLIVFDPGTGHPGFITLLPVVGTALLIAFATSDTFVGKLLGIRPLVGIGLISYSAYLWHHPIFAFAQAEDSVVSARSYGILIGVSFVLAYASWRFVEQPFRRRQFLTRSQIMLSATAGSVAIVAFGLIGHLTNGFTGFERQARLVSTTSDYRSPRYCTERPRTDLIADACVYGSVTNPMIAILGDSHASMIAHQLSVDLSPSGHSLIEFSHAACPPAPGLDIHTAKGKGCAEYNDRVRQRLSRGDIKVVVMVARWSQYVDREPFDNLEGGSDNWVSYATAVDSVQISTSEQERIADVGRLYAQSVEQLLRDGVRVVLVYPVPEVGWNVPKEKARRTMAGVKTSIATGHEAFLKRNAVTYAAFDHLADSPNLIRVKPEQILCDSFMKDRCVAELEDRLLYSDGNHLDDATGAPLIAKQIVQAMVRHGWLSKS